MFKETPVEKLIDYIRTLPEEQQQLIAEKITVKKKGCKAESGKKDEQKNAGVYRLY